MLIDNNESVALSSYCIKFVTHHKGQYIASTEQARKAEVITLVMARMKAHIYLVIAREQRQGACPYTVSAYIH